jgi:hypothetical protein
MEFISVFDEASRDHEAEASLRSLTAAQVEAQALWPFLALARSEEEFGHRLALVNDRLEAISDRHGVSMDDLTEQYRTAFKEAVLAPKAADLEAEAAGVRCRNCGHSNPPHKQGGECSQCGCESYAPRVQQRAAAKDRGPSYDPSSVSDLPLHDHSLHRESQYTEGYDHGYAGEERKGYGSRDKAIAYGHGYAHGKADSSKTGAKEGSDDDRPHAEYTLPGPNHPTVQVPLEGPSQSTIEEVRRLRGEASFEDTPWQTAHNGNPAQRVGDDGLYYNHNGEPYSEECSSGDGVGCDGGDCSCNCHSPHAPKFKTNEDVANWHKEGSRSASFEDRIAAIRTALMDGQDPLEWVRDQNPPGGPQYAERPGGHLETQVFEGEEANAYREALEGGGGGAPTHHDTAPQVKEGSRPLA